MKEVRSPGGSWNDFLKKKEVASMEILKTKRSLKKKENRIALKKTWRNEVSKNGLRKTCTKSMGCWKERDSTKSLLKSKHINNWLVADGAFQINPLGWRSLLTSLRRYATEWLSMKGYLYTKGVHKNSPPIIVISSHYMTSPATFH